MKKYELIDHTADVGIKAYGKDLKELFENAALGMFEIMADLKSVRPTERIDVKIEEAPSKEELLVSWLRELLYKFAGSKYLLCDFSIDEINDRHLAAKVRGEAFDPKRHEIIREIKAVTYHGLKIEKGKEGRSAQVIFDI